jgi:hypothetical protein
VNIDKPIRGARHQFHLEQAPDDRDVAEPIKKETSRDADNADQNSGDRRTDHARAIEDH